MLHGSSQLSVIQEPESHGKNTNAHKIKINFLNVGEGAEYKKQTEKQGKIVSAGWLAGWLSVP